MNRRIISEIKAIPGWRHREKLVVFAVDDYGSVRLRDRRARDALESRLPGFGGQMDLYDAVETRQDLEALYEVLGSVSGSDGRNAVFTAYTLMANPDFSVLRQERKYGYESLPRTFERLASEQSRSYEGAWKLWEEGIDKGLLWPQFHGREHLNVPLLQHKLDLEEFDLSANLEFESMAGLLPVSVMPSIQYTKAFSLIDSSWLPQQRCILEDGLDLFQAIFDFRSETFAPPGLTLHPSHDDFVGKHGVKAIDRSFFERQPLGATRFRSRFNWLSPKRNDRLARIVRTLSFEPCSGKAKDPVGQAMMEMEAAFRWKKPVIISSHRVNYAGHIDEQNRKDGLARLKELLRRVKQKWPELRFITADELVEIMNSTSDVHR